MEKKGDFRESKSSSKAKMQKILKQVPWTKILFTTRVVQECADKLLSKTAFNLKGVRSR